MYILIPNLKSWRFSISISIPN